MNHTQRLFDSLSWGYDFITCQHFWSDEIANALHRVSNLDTAKRVLDLGCGPGVSAFVIARELPNVEVVGIDISKRMIERAEAHLHQEHADLVTRVSFKVADVTKLPLGDESFDIALGHSFLYLLPHRSVALSEVHRVLKDHGSAVFMEPNRHGNLVNAVRTTALRAKSDMAERAKTRDALLHPFDTARFALSMMLWRAVSMKAGQLSAGDVEQLLQGAGFSEIKIDPTLAGLGLHCLGNKSMEVAAKDPSQGRRHSHQRVQERAH